MKDSEPKLKRFEQLISVTTSLATGHLVSQGDVKTAVLNANQIRQENYLTDLDVQLALALGNFNFWNRTMRISFDPDKELANELTTLQKRVLLELRARKQHIPTIDCINQPRSHTDIQLDIDTAEHNQLVTSRYLGELINQATPKEE